MFNKNTNKLSDEDLSKISGGQYISLDENFKIYKCSKCGHHLWK